MSGSALAPCALRLGVPVRYALTTVAVVLSPVVVSTVSLGWSWATGGDVPAAQAALLLCLTASLATTLVVDAMVLLLRAALGRGWLWVAVCAPYQAAIMTAVWAAGLGHDVTAVDLALGTFTAVVFLINLPAQWARLHWLAEWMARR